MYLLLMKITTGQIIRAPTVATLPALWDFIMRHGVRIRIKIVVGVRTLSGPDAPRP